MRVFQVPSFILCSKCFLDHGLELEAYRIGTPVGVVCNHCGVTDGRKLTKSKAKHLAYCFFSIGSIRRFDYGVAPRVAINYRPTEIEFDSSLKADAELLHSKTGLGAFHYGPRYWMFGEIAPLKDLQEKTKRKQAIDRILSTYPTYLLPTTQKFYRVRNAPTNPELASEYDSPPDSCLGRNRLETKSLPIMYASSDIATCLQETRISVEDDLYIATLSPTRDLKLLDLTQLIEEDNVTEFESLDLAVHMLFLAGGHSYEICKEIASAAYFTGFDGIIYPSHYSNLRTGTLPIETTYGISHRRIKSLAAFEQSKVIPNLAVFGRPIKEKKIQVVCINRLVVTRIDYMAHFGPVIPT